MTLSTKLDEWQSQYDTGTLSSASDFRSDTVTLPTVEMISSILEHASELGDDVFSEVYNTHSFETKMHRGSDRDHPTNELERYLAELTGMQHALFVLSGTMGNQLALRSLLERPPSSVICDRRSHIYEWECGMASIFSQAHMIPVLPNLPKQAYLTLEEIIPNIVPDDGDVHCAPTKLISLENTFGGKIMPVAEVKRISAYAKAHGIRIHLDGARLWNACYSSDSTHLTPESAANAATKLLREYCSTVDSVSLCFSKSLGAPGGSILLLNSATAASCARHFRKALGGGMRQTGILTAPARTAVDTVFLSGVHLPKANALAKAIEEAWKRRGGPIQKGMDQETNMVWLDLERAGVSNEDFVKAAENEGIKVYDGRIVTHHRKSRAVS